ncbi:MAG: hypothetical protein K8R53_07800 [Bacteroidales bacterium]|nr:hypothetical protein [Bacteroidales bacterium]
MENILKTIIKVLIFGTIVTAVVYYFKIDLYRDLVKEDGLIENITALTLLISSGLLLFRLIKVGHSKNTKWIVFNVIMILGLFFGFGEEISWGQRIFSIDPSGFFYENNLQKETNLHNLKLYDLKINKIVFSYGFTLIFGFYFLFSLFLFKKNRYFKKIIDKYGIPIPKIQHTVSILAAILIITSIPDGRKWELWECLFVLISFLVILQPHNINEKLFLK